MITLYSGTPGSGKSMHATMTIDAALRRKCPVICNYELFYDKNKMADNFHFYDNDCITPDFLMQFAARYWQDHHFKEEGILLVLDECQLLFNSREWDRKGRKDWLTFFSQHRKYGYSVLLIAQFDRMLDRQIRSLIEYNVIHRKVKNFGIKGKIYNALLGGSLYVAVKIFYPINQPVGSHMIRAKKWVFKLYDSHGTFRDFGTSAPLVAGRGVPATEDGGAS